MKTATFLFVLSTLLISCEKGGNIQPPITKAPLGHWEKMADYPGPERFFPVSFVLGNKAYVGGGAVGRRDFHAYDPVANVWQPLADLPVGRSEAVHFALNGKGYMVTGIDSMGNTQEVWEYDPSNDAWTQKNDFPGAARSDAASFVIGDKAYMGTGWSVPQPGVQLQLSDWWAYDPATDSWSAKAPFPGGPCSFAAGIGLGSTGYLGVTGKGPSPGKQWWAYHPDSDAWTELAEFPGRTRYAAGIFAMGNRIFVGSGTMGTGINPADYVYDWWAYDTASGEWLEAGDCETDWMGGAAFSLGNTGYFGLGFSNEKGYGKEFWRFVLD